MTGPVHLDAEDDFEALSPDAWLGGEELRFESFDDVFIDDEAFRNGGPPVSDWSAGGYDKAVVDSVWNFGAAIEGNDPSLWRKDEFGAWIHRLEHGNRNSEFGWEICATGAGRRFEGLTALRPMQWQNYLDRVAALTQSRMTADGLRNARKIL